MRVISAVLLIAVLPAALCAAPTIGVYFTNNPGQMEYDPVAYEMFSGYVYLHNMPCYVTGAEFRLSLPAGIALVGYEVPGHGLYIGDLVNGGMAIAYWPPLNGYDPGYTLLCRIELLATKWCVRNGQYWLIDAFVRVGQHEESHAIQVACYPENNLVPVVGLTSIICPVWIGTKDKSWGSIKALYK